MDRGTEQYYCNVCNTWAGLFHIQREIVIHNKEVGHSHRHRQDFLSAAAKMNLEFVNIAANYEAIIKCVNTLRRPPNRM